MTSNSGEMSSLYKVKCIACLGAGLIQWLEGCGNPVTCVACDGKGWNEGWNDYSEEGTDDSC